jgi:MFS family permease
VHIANYALVHGLSLSQATTLVAVMGIASAAGRVVLGYAADSLGKLNMLKACTISAVIVNFSWIACTDFASLVVFALLFGFFGGGFIALIPNVCSLLFGLEKQGNVMGVMLTATAIGNLLSSPIAGFIFDVYKEYYPSILVAGAFNVIGVCIIFFVHVDDSYHRAPTATDSAKNLTVEDDAMAAV